jgi:phosphoribosyl 1,2-cyclic phosphate phosphodiesterase
MQATLTILGSGTSMGVPTLGCTCAVCTSTDPRNNRTRPSIAIEWKDYRALIDTGPDFRHQAMREKITRLDAVFYTHAHADHILGLDDLRPLTFHRSEKLPLYADSTTADVLERIFEYTFSPNSHYPTRARVELHRLNDQESVDIGGIRFQRVPIQHGRLTVGGYRVGSAAYLTDMNAIPESSLPLLEDLDILILDALRITPHPSHANVEEALKWVERVKPRRAFFTHISHELEQTATEASLPPQVRLAYDGMRLPFEI